MIQVSAALAFLLANSAGAEMVASSAVDLDQVGRDVVTAEAEIARLEAQYQSTPQLFSLQDQEDRAVWGSIYHLNRDFERASLALYGALQATPPANASASAFERDEALYLLADSLFQLGNVWASKKYFEELLDSKGSLYSSDAVRRLMEIAARENRFDEVDRYFEHYKKVAGDDIPGDVRYLRGRSLFFARRDDDALRQLSQVKQGDGYDLRARYLKAAIATRRNNLEDALNIFSEIVTLKPISREDAAVRELAAIGRGRILYELERLDESVAAYQAIDYDSPYLTTMLYEVTLVYVRRGQLALRGSRDDGLTDLQRRDRAREEYQQALRQLDDLRSLEPDSENSSEIELLAANLRLQRLEFEQAEEIFRNLLARYRTVDGELQNIMADAAVADKVLSDLLALEKDSRASLQSPLPLLAARRAGKLRDVAQAVKVFKRLQEIETDVAISLGMLDRLEESISPSNPSRAELFKPLKTAVERSLSLSNSLLGLRRTVAASQRATAPSAALATPRFVELSQKRDELEEQVAALPTTVEQYEVRRARFRERADGIDRLIHELELTNNHLRAAAGSIEWLAMQDSDTNRAISLRNRAHDVGDEISSYERAIQKLKERLSAVRTAAATSGGRGSAEERLRTELEAAYQEEWTLLRSAGLERADPDGERLDSLFSRIDAVKRRNEDFRERLDHGVDKQLENLRVSLAEERRALKSFEAKLSGLNTRASAMRGEATAEAIEKVRDDIGRVVLRGDVGLADAAFSRKQAETETISALQRARAAELTDLTQAYADLTKDEQP
jgi:tetratricopeptide (TPR) repeat protein